MSRSLVVFVGITIATYLAFFVIEALLWKWPVVHGILLKQLNWDLSYSVSDQAIILRALFINQGIYNLMLAIAGMVGLYLVSRGRHQEGELLIGSVCWFALGAAAILLTTTHAYALGVAQASFPAAALMLLWRDRQRQP